MIYYMVILIGISGGSVTTVQMPLDNVTDKATCEMIGAKGAQSLAPTSDHVEFVCVPVKK